MRNFITKELIARELTPLPSNEASPDFIPMTEPANIILLIAKPDSMGQHFAPSTYQPQGSKGQSKRQPSQVPMQV